VKLIFLEFIAGAIIFDLFIGGFLVLLTSPGDVLFPIYVNGGWIFILPMFLPIFFISISISFVIAILYRGSYFKQALLSVATISGLAYLLLKYMYSPEIYGDVIGPWITILLIIVIVYVGASIIILPANELLFGKRYN
jgi:hypothetical protein